MSVRVFLYRHSMIVCRLLKGSVPARGALTRAFHTHRNNWIACSVAHDRARKSINVYMKRRISRQPALHRHSILCVFVRCLRSPDNDRERRSQSQSVGYYYTHASAVIKTHKQIKTSAKHTPALKHVCTGFFQMTFSK